MTAIYQRLGNLSGPKTVFGSYKFDAFALTCSALYFIFFASSIGCIITSGGPTQCVPNTDLALTFLKIIFLIPPLLFFAKLCLQAIFQRNQFTIERFQLGILLAYFVLVFFFLCFYVKALLNGQNPLTDPDAQNTNTFCLFVLPIFIIASFYSTYELWKAPRDKVPMFLVYLNLTLSVLYYALFYFSLRFGGNSFGQTGNTSINGILLALAIMLIFQFLYAAGANYKKSGWKRLDWPVTKYMGVFDGFDGFLKSLGSRFGAYYKR